jgi:catechol 2,3-dioxygenase-like lactoylglutathione lyase family enzyme
VVGGHDGGGPPGRRRSRSAPAVWARLLRSLRPRSGREQFEAVHHGEPRGGANRLDHLWIRVRDLGASRRFYETVAPVVGLRIEDGSANCFHVAGAGRSFALVQGAPPTENVHLAFPASDRATVEVLHRAALEAGFRDNGGPGERRYHPGYGAYVLDPDG